MSVAVKEQYLNPVQQQYGTSAAVFDGIDALLDAINALKPEILARGDEIEELRAVPADLQAKLMQTGVFRMIRPLDLGGAGYPLTDALRGVEAVAALDGSMGWSLMVGSESPTIWMRFPPEKVRQVFGTADEVMTRAALTPKGTIIRKEGGYLLRGRWPLVSGSYTPNWFLIGGIVSDESGALVMGSDGQPEKVIVAISPEQVRVCGNWDSFGLRSTESHDIEVADKFVPDADATPYFAIQPDGHPLARMPLLTLLTPFHLGVVLGITRGMLDDLREACKTRRTLLAPKITQSADPVFQQKFAHFALRLEAARTYALEITDRLWQATVDRREFTIEEQAHCRSATALVHDQCRAIGNEIFDLGGTGVLYNPSSLQRRFRDLRSACLHIYASLDLLRPLGALMLGEDNDMIAFV